MEQSTNSATRSLKLKLTRIKHEPGINQPQPSTERVESQNLDHNQTVPHDVGFGTDFSDASNTNTFQHHSSSAMSNSGSASFEKPNGSSTNAHAGFSASQFTTDIQKPTVSNIKQSQANKDYSHTPPIVESQPTSMASKNPIDRSVASVAGSHDTPRRRYSGKGNSASRSKKKSELTLSALIMCKCNQFTESICGQFCYRFG